MDKIRYCKKCNTELMSTNKGSKCDACKRKTVSTIKKGIAVVFGAVFLGTLVKNNNDDRSSESKDDSDDEKQDSSERDV